MAGLATTSTPTRLAVLPPLLAYAQSVGVECFLDRPKRGVPTLTLVLFWLVLAWLGRGRPFHLDRLVEPLLATLLGRTRLPCAKTLSRSLTRLAAKDLRAAVDAAYQAELPRRSGRVWYFVAW